MTIAQQGAAFSPSLNHRHLLDSIAPSMAYDGGDVSAWQERLRPKISSLLGIPAGDRVPLDVRTQWRRRHPWAPSRRSSSEASPTPT